MARCLYGYTGDMAISGYKAMQSNAKQSNESNAKQCKADAKQSKAMQSKAVSLKSAGPYPAPKQCESAAEASCCCVVDFECAGRDCENDDF